MKNVCYLVIISSIIFVLSACDNSSNIRMDNTIEKNLKNNTTWPHLIVGVLDIAHAEGYDDDSGYPSVAAGQIDTGNQLDDISIEITGDVLKAAGIDIDSGEKLKIWVTGPPRHEYDIDIYKVVKLEKFR